jgi:hypothetical protein
MQQKIGIIRSGLPAGSGAIRVNLPLHAVQSMLKANAVQVRKILFLLQTCTLSKIIFWIEYAEPC